MNEIRNPPSITISAENVAGVAGNFKINATTERKRLRLYQTYIICAQTRFSCGPFLSKSTISPRSRIHSAGWTSVSVSFFSTFKNAIRYNIVGSTNDI